MELGEADLVRVKFEAVVRVAGVELGAVIKVGSMLGTDSCVAGEAVLLVLVKDPAAAAETPTVTTQLPLGPAVALASETAEAPGVAVRVPLTDPVPLQITPEMIAASTTIPEPNVSVKDLIVSAFVVEALVSVMVSVAACPALIVVAAGLID